MSTADLIQSGIAHANHAIENDKAACNTNDPTYFRHAEHNYKLAISLYNQAHTQTTDPVIQTKIHTKVSEYTRRRGVMLTWLESYQKVQNREVEAEKKRSSLPAQRLSSLPTDDPFTFENSRSTRKEGGPSRSYELGKSGGGRQTSNIYPVEQPITEGVQNGPFIPSAPSMSSLGDSVPYSRLSAVPQKQAKKSIDAMGSSQPRLESAKVSVKSRHAGGNAMSQVIEKGGREAGGTGVVVERVAEKGWGDVIGLRMAKEIMKEGIVAGGMEGLNRGGVRKKWATVLLYGPTGTGKRLLIEATAKEGGMKYVEVHGGDLKEGLAEVVRVVRDMGKVVVHIEDVEKIKGGIRGHEVWDDVLWVFTSREPWRLEDAILRRMERRVYVGIPGQEDRAVFLEILLREVSHDITLQEIEFIARECENFSGADMESLVRDAMMEPLRIVRDATCFRLVNIMVNSEEKKLYTPCSRGEGAVERRVGQLGVENIHIPEVGCLDFDVAMESTKPSIRMETLRKHIEFTKLMGMDGS